MAKFINSTFVKDMCNITRQSYDNGWDERNGGNMSIRIIPEELKEYEDVKEVKRVFDLGFDASGLKGQYFLVTGTGRYFRNVFQNTEKDLGLVRISADGQKGEIVWGYTDGALPTSEFPTHLMNHYARLKLDPRQRVVMHCHLTNLIAMSFTQPLDEKYFSKTIWKMQAESMPVLPEGIGIIPYETPGTTVIGEHTAAKVADGFRVVMWPHHGIFAVGDTPDECFGLIETVEKAATIFTAIQAQGGNRLDEITDEQLVEIAKYFHVTPREGFLD